MTKLYKLTTQDNVTRPGFPNACFWGEGVSHSGTGVGGLCGPGFIHAYTHPVLAMALNPVHAAFQNPKMWEAEGVIEINDNGLKVGCLTLTTTKEICPPQLSPVNKISLAILIAMDYGGLVGGDRSWMSFCGFDLWASDWLGGSDRSRISAEECQKKLRMYSRVTEAGYDTRIIAVKATDMVRSFSPITSRDSFDFCLADTIFYAASYAKEIRPSLSESRIGDFLVRNAEKCLEYK